MKLLILNGPNLNLLGSREPAIYGSESYDALCQHYSYAIYDALRAVNVPAVEVHISDITAREPFRAVSVTAPACVKTICGHGLRGYLEAMDYLKEPVRP